MPKYIRIQKKDRDMIRHIERNRFLTISQAGKIFYGDTKAPYSLAQRRLDKLHKYNYLKKSISKSGIVVYSLDKRQVSTHDIFVMDYYAKLIQMGAKFVYFKQPYEWKTIRLTSDALAIYKIDNVTFHNCLEVSHSRNKIQIEAYEQLMKSQEVLEKCNGTYPTIVIADDRVHSPTFYSKTLPIVQVNTSLSDIGKALVYQYQYR